MNRIAEIWKKKERQMFMEPQKDEDTLLIQKKYNSVDFSEKYLVHGTNKEEISNRLLSGLAKEIEIVQGVFLNYNIRKKGKELSFLSGYACGKRDPESYAFGLGEGFPGQVANDRKPIIINEVPEAYLTIRTGLGEAKPRSMIILPVENNGKLIGVLELASFKPFSPEQEKFLVAVAKISGDLMVTQKK